MEDKHTQTNTPARKMELHGETAGSAGFPIRRTNLMRLLLANTSSFYRFVPRPRPRYEYPSNRQLGLMLVSACVYFRPVVVRGSVCAAALIMGSLRACPRHVAEMMCCASGTLWCLSFNRTKPKRGYCWNQEGLLAAVRLEHGVPTPDATCALFYTQ